MLLKDIDRPAVTKQERKRQADLEKLVPYAAALDVLTLPLQISIFFRGLGSDGC